MSNIILTLRGRKLYINIIKKKVTTSWLGYHMPIQHMHCYCVQKLFMLEITRTNVFGIYFVKTNKSL